MDDIELDALVGASTSRLMARAEAMTQSAHGSTLTYSRKVFIPLTKLCRDVCHYCTFATTPAHMHRAYLGRDDVLAIVRAGEEAGCREALFTLGDKPEARYTHARDALRELGHDSTLSYLREIAGLVLKETSLLPHLNPGLMSAADYHALRPHAVSMGIMLESAAERLCERGGPHFGSPDKRPSRRLASIAQAGEAGVALTTGLLIGIGETRAERIDALRAIRDLHVRFGHIQEVIIQNFRAKPGTRMEAHPEPSLDEHLWTIAAARVILGPEMSLQAPPNLQPGALTQLVRAGINDWGGVSPVTPDHVNPEAPWPHLAKLREETENAGRELRERLAIAPRHAREPERWLDAALAPRVRRLVDARGLPYKNNWRAGRGDPAPRFPAKAPYRSRSINAVVQTVSRGERPQPQHIVALFEADGEDAAFVARAADELRRASVGDAITYVCNRNINYTNICLYRCGFCAFSKGTAKALRGPAYRLDLDEIGRRAAEGWERGATEVCLQGGIHPDYDGNTYLNIVQAVREAAPDIHIHAFSPLEIMHGASTLSLPLKEYLTRLKDAGLSTLPGTAAEILDDAVRAIICPDKLTADQWLSVMRSAHEVGLRSTATIMFGHVDAYAHWARHLLAVRDLQEETSGFTEFVPLPFIHMEAPIWRKGLSRSGPSYREAVLMHAVARLALHPLIPNIQTSWVKMGAEGATACLDAGANDLGGTLMDESITRAAGGANGQEMNATHMRRMALDLGRPLRERSTLYGSPARSQRVAEPCERELQMKC